MSDWIYEELCKIVGEENIAKDVIMKKHTTFRIGGNADYFLTPKTEGHICESIDFCKKNDIKYYIIGNGSNILVSDEGIRGVVIKLFDNFADYVVEGNKIIAKPGILLSKLSNIAASKGLTGLEFAGGIPGTLGGAIAMNAGAYGGEMKDVVTGVKVLDAAGKIITIDAADMNFGYRKSVVSQNNYIVVEVEMELKEGDEEEIRAKMNELKLKRTSKQPLDLPSAGSTFKRPEGYFAGKLIMDAGLKGYSIGGAQVSEKHCGFIVNKSNATAGDVLKLIKYIQKTVHEKFNVDLETEIKMIGKM